MTVTGRAGLVALALIVLLAGSPAPGLTLPAANLLLVLLLVVDMALAGSPRRLSFERRLPSSGRLGENLPTALPVHNAGSRLLQGRLRDAWPPSAGLSPAVSRVRIPAGERRRIESMLQPVRRGDRRPRAVVVRAIGPLGLAGRQRTVRVPGQVRVLPHFRSRALLPEK